MLTYLLTYSLTYLLTCLLAYLLSAATCSRSECSSQSRICKGYGYAHAHAYAPLTCSRSECSSQSRMWWRKPSRSVFQPRGSNRRQLSGQRGGGRVQGCRVSEERGGCRVQGCRVSEDRCGWTVRGSSSVREAFLCSVCLHYVVGFG